MDTEKQRDLEAQIARLEKINHALIERVEQSTNVQGSSFDLFHAAIQLERKVEERTSALERALQDLGRSNVELTAARDKADEANRAKSEFLANMSHEIRTPMNGILGILEILARTPMENKQTRLVTTIKRSALSLLAIIDDILDFSKIEARKIELESVSFSLRKLLNDSMGIWNEWARDKGLRFLHTVADDVPDRLSGDPTRMGQVLTNLVGNGIKFTSQGEVSVRIEALSFESGDTLRIVVRDTGIGLSEAAQRRVFESFSQADSSTTREYGGTGLGLAIVKQLVHAMHGTVGVESAEGEGATFWVEVPLVLASQEDVPASGLPDADAPVGDHASLRSVRVLMAEDNEINREVAEEMLGLLGCITVSAENGAIALAEWKKSDFDIVLLDCQMPVMDGFETVKEIRRLEAEAGGEAVPILAVTANAMKSDRDRCHATGMDGFLSKPYTLEQLKESMAELLRPGCGLGLLPDLSVSQLTDEVAAGPMNRLRQLEELGRAGAVQRLVSGYLKNTDLSIARMKRALIANDFGTLERESHSLKSSSGVIGATGVAELAAAVEAAGRSEQAAPCTELLSELERAFLSMIPFLEAERDRNVA